MRPVLEGASEKQTMAIIERIESDLPRARAVILESFEELNVLAEAKPIAIPMLYLEPSVPLAGVSEMVEVVRKLAPGAEMGQLVLWPGQLHDPASGEELAAKAISFLDKHSVTAQ
jgi:hypothetical protein